MISLPDGALEDTGHCVGCNGCSAEPMPVAFIPSLLVPLGCLVIGAVVCSLFATDQGQLAGGLAGFVAGILVARYRASRNPPMSVTVRSVMVNTSP